MKRVSIILAVISAILPLLIEVSSNNVRTYRYVKHTGIGYVYVSLYNPVNCGFPVNTNCTYIISFQDYIFPPPAVVVPNPNYDNTPGFVSMYGDGIARTYDSP